MWDKFKSSLPNILPTNYPSSNDAPAFDASLPNTPPLQVDASSKSAWRLACSAYSQSSHVSAPLLQAPPFAGYGKLHLAVADTLLDRSEELKQQGNTRIIHIASNAGLLAVYSPRQQLVQLRARPTALSKATHVYPLVTRMMPASARPLEGVAAQGFQVISLAALLWYFGQNAAQALRYVPDLGQQTLRIRRFPPLEPASLLLRHLRLLHVISQSKHSYESLLGAVHPEQHAMLCPDLASLHLSGALSVQKA